MGAQEQNYTKSRSCSITKTNSNTCNLPKYELTFYQKILIIQGNKDQRNSHTFENELTNRSLGKNKPRIHLLIADEEEIMHKNIT